MDQFNSLTTVGYLLEVFIMLWIPSMVRIFIFCLKARTGNLSQGFIDIFSVGSQPWTRERSIVRALQPENAPQD